jgi:phosphatidate cytidylyltransferase
MFGEKFPVWLQAFILVPITFIASVVGQIGDLVASKLKRTYNLKDFGNILPGHGGILIVLIR